MRRIKLYVLCEQQYLKEIWNGFSSYLDNDLVAKKAIDIFEPSFFLDIRPEVFKQALFVLVERHQANSQEKIRQLICAAPQASFFLHGLLYKNVINYVELLKRKGHKIFYHRRIRHIAKDLGRQYMLLAQGK